MKAPAPQAGNVEPDRCLLTKELNETPVIRSFSGYEQPVPSRRSGTRREPRMVGGLGRPSDWASAVDVVGGPNRYGEDTSDGVASVVPAMPGAVLNDDIAGA